MTLQMFRIFAASPPIRRFFGPWAVIVSLESAALASAGDTETVPRTKAGQVNSVSKKSLRLFLLSSKTVPEESLSFLR